MLIEKFLKIINILIGDFPSEYEWLILIFFIVLITSVVWNIWRCVKC